MSTESSGAADARDGLDSLELPSMAPRNLIRQFGPGLILMMTGIGTSHLVTAPVAVSYTHLTLPTKRIV